jgi:kynurenine formamidase
LPPITSQNQNPIGIDHLARGGIVSRGVLVDVARYFSGVGRPLRPVSRDAIPLVEFQAALQAQQTVLEAGDILLLRTGWLQQWRASPEFRAEMGRTPRIPGLGGAAEWAEFLWDTRIAAVGCDNPTVEVFPFENEADQLHHRLAVQLGMPLAEMLDLEELAQVCAQDGRYEFFFSAAPLNLPGGAGSPANALAIR